MPTGLEVLEAEVLRLAPADRSRLLERLVASLDADPDVDASWARETERRVASLDSGEVAVVSAEDAKSRLRNRLVR